MIYDCFPFYNELEVLDIRLHELDRVVDKFVLVESTVTHTNKPKPLYYKENKHLFKKFHKKIIHIVVDDVPDIDMTWVIERYLFTAVERGLKNAKPNDTILYSSADEIPRAEKVLEWKDKPGAIKAFDEASCYYFLNFVDTKKDDKTPITVTRMFKYKEIKRLKDIYYAYRVKPNVVIPNGGWHFSYIGGVKRIQDKIASFAHQELNNDEYNTPEKIKRSMIQGKDPFGYGRKFKVVDVDMLPEYVINNQKKFKDLIITRNNLDSSSLRLNLFYLDIRHILRVKFFRKIRRILNSGK